MNKYPFLKINEEVILEVVSFNFQNNIEEYLHLIQWEGKAVGEASEKIGIGKSVKYKVKEKFSGKKILIQKVTGTKEAFVGDTVDLRVTGYNMDSNKISESQKKQIKWDVKVVGGEKKVLMDDKKNPFLGEVIRFIVPKSWGGNHFY